MASRHDVQCIWCGDMIERLKCHRTIWIFPHCQIVCSHHLRSSLYWLLSYPMSLARKIISYKLWEFLLDLLLLLNKLVSWVVWKVRNICRIAVLIRQIGRKSFQMTIYWNSQKFFETRVTPLTCMNKLENNFSKWKMMNGINGWYRASEIFDFWAKVCPQVSNKIVKRMKRI